MIAELIIFLYCSLIFLFTLYTLSKEDFVLLRKNISVAAIFDIFFVIIIAGIIFSRIFFVGFQFDPSYLNPVIFFLVPYFPGLSLIGFVCGTILSLLILTKRRKFPSGRIIDFFAVSFLAVLPFGYLGAAVLSRHENILFAFLPVIYYTLLSAFFLKFMIPRFLSGQMRDGMIGLLILMNYSLFSCVLIVIASLSKNNTPFIPEFFVLVGIFSVTFILYLRNGLMVSARR